MKKLFPLIILVNILLSLNLYAAKNLYLSIKEIPNQVYKNQRFEVVVKALVTTKNFDYLSTTFSKGINTKVLNPNSKWEKVSSNVYENRYYFKALDKITLPRITVKLMRGSGSIDTSVIGNKAINYSDIAKGDKRFSSIIAKDLMLKAYKTKQYNNKESLTIVDIEAVSSNLEDFKLQDISEQGQSDLKDNYPNQNLIYYFVMPVHKKKVVFTYYNTTTKSFVDVRIPLVLQNELVSTQTDLNPNDSSFEKYKKAAVAVLLLIFIVLTVWKRKKILIFITTIIFIGAVIYLMPNRTGYVKEGSYIYILPTKNSTIFFKLEKSEKVEVLTKKKGFIKIIGIDNNFIGWIKEENLGKN